MNTQTRSLTAGIFAAALVLLLAGCATTRPMKTQAQDATITAKVKSKLVADPQVNPFEIDVDTRSGVVRLSGTVEDEADRAEAERLARETAGVKSVDNRIRIGDPRIDENLSDAVLLSKIKTKLTADPQINPFNIDVDVVRGVVTLSGRVADPAAREEAERLALATRGVKEVRNDIVVGDLSG